METRLVGWFILTSSPFLFVSLVYPRNRPDQWSQFLTNSFKGLHLVPSWFWPDAVLVVVVLLLLLLQIRLLIISSEMIRHWLYVWCFVIHTEDFFSDVCQFLFAVSVCNLHGVISISKLSQSSLLVCPMKLMSPFCQLTKKGPNF